ncbi:MFS general substrate transporter, partial [Zopfia rhizophila CBS 207.26]
LLAICRIGEPLVVTSIPLYMPAMLKSLKVPEQSVPYWASICISVYSVSLCLSAPIWGWAADRWGRRPTILLATLFQMISMVLFGFSRTLLWPVITSGFLGLASANSGTLRTTAAELVPWKELQPKAFGILPMVWNIGRSIIGPLLGGLLSNPASQYPRIFGANKFFSTFPWVLPNMVVCTLLLAGLVSGILFLEETLEISKGRQGLGLRKGKQTFAWIPLRLPNNPHTAIWERPRDIHGEIGQHLEYQVGLNDSGRLKYRIFTTRACLNLLAHALLVTHSMIYDEFLPIFMYTKRELVRSHLHTAMPRWLAIDGGLGLQSSQISAYFTISAIYAVAIQLTIFPLLARRFGTLGSFKVSSLIFPLIYVLVPFLVLLPPSKFMGRLAILALLLSKSTGTTISFPCSMILLSNSATSKRILGTLNGLATSTSALCRGVGALAFGTLFTLGLEKGSVVLPWWLLSIIAALGAVPLFWRIDPDEDKEKQGDERNLHLWNEDDLGSDEDAEVRLLNA